MWSAAVMMEMPDIVRDLHIDYINAGAKVITLNTYSVTPDRLQRWGDPTQFKPLTEKAIELAHTARDKAGVSGVKIAGSLGPLVASYRPDIAPDFETALESYRDLVTTQARGVDFFMAETIASLRETRAVAIAAAESGKPIWVALSVEDNNSGNLRSGESLQQAIEILDELEVDAVMLNCSKPESISSCWPQLDASTRPVGAYANGFTSIAALQPGGTVASLEARHDLGPDEYAAFAMDWVSRGASIVGGCCEVGPDHIAAIAQTLSNSGYTISADLA